MQQLAFLNFLLSQHIEYHPLIDHPIDTRAAGQSFKMSFDNGHTPLFTNLNIRN